MKIGDTFIWCPGTGVDHLWIIISDPAKNDGQLVMVNLTESCHGKYSFVLKPGQHSYIYKDSDVNFGDALKTTVSELQKQIGLGYAKPNDDLDSTILEEIIRNALTHAAFPPHLRKLLS